MLRVKIRYLLGIMALILGSGITVTGLAAPSPISQTEQVAQSKTYRLSELEGPYVTFMNRSKLERRYLFTNWRQPLNATQIADDQMWASIEAEMADAKLSQGFTRYFGSGVYGQPRRHLDPIYFQVYVS
ncbi:hypothetical protein L3X07_03825 [Levilactobacillus brevis]|nr:hypothetical protein [Levilactobacillus brevis]